MDLEAYISRYRGETRLQRLLHIGKTSNDTSLVTQAYELAEAQMKEDGNVLRYKEVFGDESGPSLSHPRARSGNVVYDHEFVVAIEANNRSTREQLSGRLSTAQAHLNKEAIRTAYLALAEADVLRGDLTEAYHAALRAKDYCTNRGQTSQVSFLVLELAIHLGNYAQAREFVYKVQHTLLPAGSNASATSGSTTPEGAADKLAVTSALERLAHGDYAEAASKFRQVRTALQWETLMAPEDVATYAAITSMATASRAELMEWLDHPEALEHLAPPLLDAIFQLADRANYSQAWKLLQGQLATLQLDVFLAPHLTALVTKIRQACILEYWIPYQRVSLAKMAQDLDFESPVALQKVLEELLWSGSLQNCRMDCRTMTLVRDVITKDTTHRQLKRLGAQVLDDTYAMVVRLACLEHDLVVIDPQQKGRGGRGGSGRSGGHHFGGGGDDDIDGDSSDGDTPMVDVSPAIIGEDHHALDQQNPEDLY